MKYEWRKAEKHHKEIYLSDARKTEQSKLKTILRFKVEKINKDFCTVWIFSTKY